MVLTIPLDEARLCLDCESLHVHASCPKCGSRQWCWLQKILKPIDRDIDDEDQTCKKSVGHSRTRFSVSTAAEGTVLTDVRSGRRTQI
jgi:hypothetical protein